MNKRLGRHFRRLYEYGSSVRFYRHGDLGISFRVERDILDPVFCQGNFYIGLFSLIGYPLENHLKSLLGDPTKEID